MASFNSFIQEVLGKVTFKPPSFPFALPGAFGGSAKPSTYESDTSASLIQRGRVLTETILESDTYQRVVSYGRILGIQSLSILDSIASDVASGGNHLFSTITDTLLTVDTINRAVIDIRTQLDTIFPAYTRAILADNPLAYYKLNESSGTTMLDSSGNNRNGSYVGAYTLQSPGIANDDPYSVYFDGGQTGSSPGSYNATTYAQIAAGVFPDATSWTYEIWARVNNAIAPGQTGSSLILQMYLVFWVNTGGKLGFQWAGPNGTLNLTGAVANSYGAWHHYVVTYDLSSDTLNVYRDTVLDITKTNATTFWGSAPKFQSAYVTYLAARPPDHSYDLPLQGYLDEAAVYNYALSPAQISAHYVAITKDLTSLSRGFIGFRLLAQSLTTPSTLVLGALKYLRNLGDTGAIGDALNRTSVLGRSLLDSNVTIGILSTAFFAFRSTSDILQSTNDLLTTLGAFSRSTGETLVAANGTLARLEIIARTSGEILATMNDNVNRFSILARSSSDVLSETDNILNRFGSFVRSASDTIASIGTISSLRGTLRSGTDIITSSDGIIGRTVVNARSTLESFGPTSALLGYLNVIARPIPETITIVGTIGRSVLSGRPLPETLVVVSDIANRFLTNSRSLFDATVESDFIGRVLSSTRAIPESEVVVDTYSRLVNSVRSLGATIVTSDSASSLQSFFRAESDIILSNAVISRTVTYLRSLGDITSLLDQPAILQGFSRLLGNVGITQDNLSRLGTFARLGSDILLENDFISRTFSTVRTLPETILGAQQFGRVVNSIRALQNSQSILDFVSTGANAIVTFTEIALSIDTINRLTKLGRTAIDVNIVQAALASLVTQVRSLGNNQLISDTISRSVQSYEYMQDASNVGDILSRTGVVFRQTTQPLTSLDTLSKVASFVRTQSGLGQTVDTILRSQNVNRFVSDIQSTVDIMFKGTGSIFVNFIEPILGAGTINRSVRSMRNAFDIDTSQDIFTSVGTIVRSLGDILNINAILGRSVNGSRGIVQTVIGADSLGRATSALRGIFEASTILDIVTHGHNLAAVLGDQIPGVDLLGRMVVQARTNIDTQSNQLQDQATKISGSMRSIANTIGITAVVNRLFVGSEVLGETSIANDTTSRLVQYSRSITTISAIGDSLSYVRGTLRAISEFVGIYDATTRVVGTSRTVFVTIDAIGATVNRQVNYVRQVSERTVSILDLVVTVLRSLILKPVTTRLYFVDTNNLLIAMVPENSVQIDMAPKNGVQIAMVPKNGVQIDLQPKYRLSLSFANAR